MEDHATISSLSPIVVADETDEASALADMLRRRGYAAYVIPLDALVERDEEHQLRLVIVDLGTEGAIPMLRELLRHQFPPPPVVGLGEEAVALEAMTHPEAFSFSAVFARPIDPTAVARKVELLAGPGTGLAQQEMGHRSSPSITLHSLLPPSVRMVLPQQLVAPSLPPSLPPALPSSRPNGALPSAAPPSGAGSIPPPRDSEGPAADQLAGPTNPSAILPLVSGPPLLANGALDLSPSLRTLLEEAEEKIAREESIPSSPQPGWDTPVPQLDLPTELLLALGKPLPGETSSDSQSPVIPEALTAEHHGPRITEPPRPTRPQRTGQLTTSTQLEPPGLTIAERVDLEVSPLSEGHTRLGLPPSEPSAAPPPSSHGSGTDSELHANRAAATIPPGPRAVPPPPRRSPDDFSGDLPIAARITLRASGSDIPNLPPAPPLPAGLGASSLPPPLPRIPLGAPLWLEEEHPSRLARADLPTAPPPADRSKPHQHGPSPLPAPPPRSSPRPAEGPPPLPSDRPVVMDRKTLLFSLARLIRERHSGSLAISVGEGLARLVLTEGDPVLAASTHPDDSLQTYLLQTGQLNTSQLLPNERRTPGYGRHAGAALVAKGLLRQDDLWSALRGHATWVFVRMLDRSQSTVTWEPEVPARLAEEPPVFGGAPGAALLVEAARRSWGVEESLVALGGRGAMVRDGGHGGLLPECQLSEADGLTVHRAKSLALGELMERGDAQDVAPLLLALTALGVLRSDVVALPASPIASSVPPEAVQRLDDRAIRERIASRMALVEDGDYFALLGVSRRATGYEIRRAYQELRHDLDPARLLTAGTADLHDSLSEILEVLEEAYLVLRDPPQRQRYRRALEAFPGA